MSKYIVVPDKKEDVDKLLDKDIYGLIIGVKNLSIYPFEMTIDDIINLSSRSQKKIIIAMNKMIHNDDLDYVMDVLRKISKSNIQKVIIYDIGIFEMAKENDLAVEFILGCEHLNASSDSNVFYHKIGIGGSYITSDITYQEILDIQKKSKMEIYYTVYGYLPIFYSRRYLLTNYFKYIKKKKTSDIYYIYNNQDKYMIREFPYGTLIYSPLVNLINNISKINKLNYLVIDLSYGCNLTVVDDYLNGKKSDNTYVAFFDTKTFYKLKTEDKANE